MNSKDTSFTIRFDPEQILQDAEAQMQKTFRYACVNQIDAFFGEITRYECNVLKKIPGAGFLMIRDFLEKKFDDPKTQAKMEEFFERNFDRIMEEAMQKALQHKANGFVFGKAAKAKIHQS